MPQNLIVSGIKLDGRDLSRGVSQAEAYLRRLEARVNELEKETKQASTALGGLGGKLMAMAGGFISFMAIRRVTKDIINTNREFQSLEMQLKTVTGSISAAETAFDVLTQFGATTPFQLKNVTDAFVQLAAFGMQPTIDQMRGMGNMASAFQRDITDMTRAIISAANGMIRPLRAFGVQSQIQGDRAKVTFRGVTYEIDRSVEAFTDLITQFGNTQFVDAMSNQMLTLNGIMSNLEDQTDLLKNKIGKAGLNMELQKMYQLVQDTVAEGDEFARVIGQTMGMSVEMLTKSMELLIKNADAIVIGLQAITSAVIMRGFVALAVKMKALTLTAVGLRTVLAALGGPAGLALVVAAAIGGPMVLAMATAKSEAQELAEHLDRVRKAMLAIKPEDLAGALEQTRRAIARMEAEKPGMVIVAGTPEKRAKVAPSAPGDLSDIAIYMRLQQRLEMLNRLLDEYNQKLAEADRERITESYTKLLQKMDDEILKLREGERAVLEQSMVREKLSEKQREEILTRYDTIQTLEREQKARESAEEAVITNQEAIDDLIGKLTDEHTALTQTQEEIFMTELAVRGASDAERKYAFDLLFTVAALKEKARLEMQAAMEREREYRKRLADYENEVELLKSAADRMGEAFADATIQIIEDLHEIEEAFADFVEFIAREILRLSFRKFVAEPLINIIVKALGFTGFGPGEAPAKPPPINKLGGVSGGGVSPYIQPGAPVVIGGGGGGGIGGLPEPAPAVIPTTVPGGAGGGQPLVIDQTINLNVNAIDTRSSVQWIREYKAVIAAAAADGVRQSRMLQAEFLRRG